MAIGDEALTQMGAKKTGAARDQNALAGCKGNAIRIVQSSCLYNDAEPERSSSASRLEKFRELVESIRIQSDRFLPITAVVGGRLSFLEERN